MAKKLVNPILFLLTLMISIFIYGSSQIIFAKNLIFIATLLSFIHFSITQKISVFQRIIVALMTILAVVMLNFSSYSELLFEFELMFILSCLILFYENAKIEKMAQNVTLSRYVFMNLFVIAILMICSQFSNEEIFEQSSFLSLILIINFMIFPFSSWFCRIIENFSWHVIFIFMIFIGKIFVFDLKMSFFMNVDHNLYWIGNFAIFTMVYSSIIAFFAISNKKILAHLLVAKFAILSLIMLSKNDNSESYMAIEIYSQMLFFIILASVFQKVGKTISDLGKLKLTENLAVISITILTVVQFCVFSIGHSFANEVLAQDFAINENFILSMVFIVNLPYGRIILNLLNGASDFIEPYSKIEKLYYLIIALLASPIILFVLGDTSLLSVLNFKIILINFTSLVLGVVMSLFFRKIEGDFALEVDIFYFDLPAYVIDKIVKPLINFSHQSFKLTMNFIKPQKDIIVSLNVGSSINVKMFVNFMIILLMLCYFA